MAAQEVPRLRLRHTPIGEVEIRVIAASEPCFRTGPVVHRQLAPRLAARLPFARNRVEAPRTRAGVNVERADKAALAVEACAPGEPHQHFVFDDNGAARGWMRFV